MLKAFKAISTIAAAYKLVEQAVSMVPPGQRARLAESFSELAEKSQENLLALLEKHAPGFIGKAVERNGGKALTREDLEATMIKLLEQKDAGKKPARQKKQPALSVK